MSIRIPKQISGQGLSPYAYYKQAHELLFGEEVAYIAHGDHHQVSDVLIDGRDVLVADTALYGGIGASRDAMPDVFEHQSITSYGAVILDVVFYRYRHPEVDANSITTLLTQEPVIGHCPSKIAELEELLDRKMKIKHVTDSGLAAEAIMDDGLYQGQGTYAICSERAGDDCGLVNDGMMSDSPGATRFIAYNNEPPDWFEQSSSLT